MPAHRGRAFRPPGRAPRALTRRRPLSVYARAGCSERVVAPRKCEPASTDASYIVLTLAGRNGGQAGTRPHNAPFITPMAAEPSLTAPSPGYSEPSSKQRNAAKYARAGFDPATSAPQRRRRRRRRQPRRRRSRSRSRFAAAAAAVAAVAVARGSRPRPRSRSRFAVAVRGRGSRSRSRPRPRSRSQSRSRPRSRSRSRSGSGSSPRPRPRSRSRFAVAAAVAGAGGGRRCRGSIVVDDVVVIIVVVAATAAAVAVVVAAVAAAAAAREHVLHNPFRSSVRPSVCPSACSRARLIVRSLLRYARGHGEDWFPPPTVPPARVLWPGRAPSNIGTSNLRNSRPVGSNTP